MKRTIKTRNRRYHSKNKKRTRKYRGGANIDFLLTNNTQLLHATKEEFLSSLLESGNLMSNIERREKGLVNIGEGYANRTICHPYYTDIPQKCTETYGVYLRLFMYGNKFFNTDIYPFKKERNYCGLVFSPKCLDGTLWHINTCENNGFIILDGNAEYGDCEKDFSITIAPQQVIDILPKTTITQIKPIETLTSDFYEQVKYTTEVVVLNSIDLKHLEKIYFMNPEHLEKYREKLDDMNISYELII
jgi:hypothetical protein